MLVASAEKLGFLSVTAKPLLPLPVLPSVSPPGTSILLIVPQCFLTHQLRSRPCLYVHIHKTWQKRLGRISFLTEHAVPLFSAHTRTWGASPAWSSRKLPPLVQLCVPWLNAARSSSRPGFENSALITVITAQVPNSQSLPSRLGAGCQGVLCKMKNRHLIKSGSIKCHSCLLMTLL